MSFKFRYLYVGMFSVCFFSASAIVSAAEWKSEPTVLLKSQYNDNVRMRADELKEGSTGFTLEPRIKFAGEEQRLWDVAIDTRARITRYQDIGDGDSENLFFNFDGGRQTELTDWRLNANYSRNTNFDTDFETVNPDSSLGDRTERATTTIAPSVRWNTSETSQVSFSLNTTQVTYGEVSRFNYRDYDNDSLSFIAYWMLAENHQLGFTSSYSKYDSPSANFSYEQSVLQLDYTHNITPTSDVKISLGGRSLDSLSTSIFGDFRNKDTGVVTNVTYSSQSELVSHRFTGGRTVSPSSFGGASEILDATYQFSIKNTERLTTKLILNASDSSTVNGTASSRRNDRFSYRVEPSVSYRLTKNWNLQFLYRHINQDYTNNINVGERASNAIYINLFLHWPKLVTTY